MWYNLFDKVLLLFVVVYVCCNCFLIFVFFFRYIEDVIEKFFKCYDKYIKVYDFKEGEDNKWRLMGFYEILIINDFFVGVVNCGVSICIFC